MPTASGSVTFTMLVVSLTSSAAVHLGDAADRASGTASAPNLPAAAQMIDMLALLQEKTRGNLTQEEDEQLTQTLRRLRVRFLEVKQSVTDH